MKSQQKRKEDTIFEKELDITKRWISCIKYTIYQEAQNGNDLQHDYKKEIIKYDIND